MNVSGFALVVNEPPEPPPTLMPSDADRFPIVTTIAHTPLPVGVTVYVAGSVVELVVIDATGLQPNWSMVGNGGFGVVELTVKACAPVPGPVNASELGATATELAGGGGPGGNVGPVTGVELLLPPPHAERHSTAPTTAKSGCKRESIGAGPPGNVRMTKAYPYARGDERPRDQTSMTSPQTVSVDPSAYVMSPLPALSIVAVAIGSPIRTMVTVKPVAVNVPVTV